jgi:hypothetical protein
MTNKGINDTESVYIIDTITELFLLLKDTIMNTAKNHKVSKHNQKARGIKNLNVTIVKKSSGISSKAQERKDIAEMIAWSIEFHSAK